MEMRVSRFLLLIMLSVSVLSFSLFVLGASFNSNNSPNTTAEPGATNQFLNFTVNNTDASKNITQVNITIPTGFTFVSGYNGTVGNSTPVNFTFASPNATWTNTTIIGFIQNDTKAYFWFNVTVPSVPNGTTYNFTISTIDTSGVYNDTNVTVTIVDTKAPTYTNSGTNASNPHKEDWILFRANWTDNGGANALANATLVINDTGSWRNITMDINSSYTWSNFTWRNTTLTPPAVINWTIWANDTAGNWNTSMNYSNFTIWGWANTTAYLYPSSIPIGSSVMINCTVRNANMSTAITTGWNVTIYDTYGGVSTNILTSISDSGGNITYNYTPSYNERILLPGVHTIKCAIQNNATDYYNVSLNGTANITVIGVWSSPNRTFAVTPNDIQLNWTNVPTAYQSNITILINSTFTNQTITIDNRTTGIRGNYSQHSIYRSGKYVASGGCFDPTNSEYDNPLLVKNAIGQYSATSELMNGNETTNFILIHYTAVCPPGRYRGVVNISNYTNANEYTNITVTIDVPISVDNQLVNSTCSGSFNGTMNGNATTYHYYYFNTSGVKTIQNATSINITLTDLNNDLDLFLFDESGNLVAKSIRTGNASEDLHYNYLPVGKMWKIALYGNFSSGTDTYTVGIYFTTLNATNETNMMINKINLGNMGASNKTIRNITIRNEGNFTYSGITETKELYHVDAFSGNTATNFTLLIPSSTTATKVSVGLNWTGASNYALSLYKPDGTSAGNSSNKRAIANVTGVTQEEFVETTGISAGLWMIEVRNNTNATFDPYNITAKFWVDNSKWISSNFSTTCAFINRTGQPNATCSYHFNFTVQNDTVSGTYKGSLFYRNGSSVLEVPLEVNVTTPVLFVNGTLDNSAVRVDENIGFNGLRVLNITVNNTGNQGMTIDSVANSTIQLNSSLYMAFIQIQHPTPIPAGGSGKLNITINISTNITNNFVGTYRGWVELNATQAHPNNTFRLNITVNLTTVVAVSITNLVTVSGADDVVDTGAEDVTIDSIVQFVNGTYVNKTVEGQNLGVNSFGVWLQERNVTSYIIPTSGYLTDYNGTAGKLYYATDNVYRLNATVPSGHPGGYYNLYQNVNFSGNATLNENYGGTGVYQYLIINRPGLKLGLPTGQSDPIPPLDEGNTTYFNMTVINYGPADASGNITLNKTSCNYATITAYNANSTACYSSAPGSTDDYFKLAISGNSTEHCNFRWKIAANSSVGAARDCKPAPAIYTTDPNFGNWTTTTTGTYWLKIVNRTTTTTTTTSGTSGATTTTNQTTPTANLEFTKAESLITIVQNSTNKTEVGVKNTGDKAQTINFTVTGINSTWWTINSTGETLAVGKSAGFLVRFSIGGVDVKDYSGKYKAESSEKSITSDFTLRVLPTETKKAEINKTMLNYTTQLSELSNLINQSVAHGLNVSEANASYSQLKEKITEAEGYIKKGDYFSAYQLFTDIETLIKDVKAKLETTKKVAEEKSKEQWKKWIIIAAGIAGAGILAYLFWPTKAEKPEGYAWEGPPPKEKEAGTADKLKGVPGKLKKALAGLKEKIVRAVKRKKPEESPKKVEKTKEKK